MKRWMLALVAIPALTAAAVIPPKTYVRDQAHSQLNFVAESRMLDAHGTFDKWEADISLDPANWGASSVVITIDTRTINTRIERRDAHLKSNDFFAADSFPTATFKSAIVNKVGEDRLNITGDLTIRGKTKRVTLPTRLVFFDAARSVGRVKGETVINRKEYGINFDSNLNPISDEVKIQFDVAFTEKK
ncbi:MAG: hypothetical protein RI891_984 [Gemmatimonadota bacterium]